MAEMEQTHQDGASENQGRPVHILLVDDNADDRVLVLRELKRAFPRMRVEEVTSQKAFEQALQLDPHLVITDYQLRWTNGFEVFRAIKSRWPECPVIMFTGTGNEEIAVEAMKSGVDDYVLKSPRHFARVSAAAKLVLKVATQKRHLELAENRYSRLFDRMPVGLFRASREGILLDVNPALVQMLGYTGAELNQRHAAELFAHPDDYNAWWRHVEREGVVQHFETRLRRRSGSVCWAESHAALDRDETSGQTIIEGSFEDISERKDAEQEREGLIDELQSALGQIQTLSGLLPICSSCKKIRDAQGSWTQVEAYIQQHSDAEFTHSYCPDCVKLLYPEVVEERAIGSRKR